MILCEWDAPDTLDRAAYTCMLVSYRLLSPQFQSSLSGVTLVYRSQCPLLTKCTVNTKGVGRGPTLAWPGWKQSVIAVEVDTGRLDGSKNVMQTVYYSTSLVLKSRVLLMFTDTVEELPGYPVQNSLSGSFLF
jgi:hypothetical protein